MDPRGKVVLLSGAAGGIGSAYARCFAREGARLALLDLREEPLQALKEELDHSGREIRAYVCNVCEEERCIEVVRQVIADFGGIDMVFNNAGISHRSLFKETSTSVFKKVMEVNVYGALHLTRAALPSVTERQGMIAVMSSVAGFAPLVGRTAYSAAKHALHGFFDSLREELREYGVGVLVICPAYIDSGMEQRNLSGNGGIATTKKAIVGTQMQPTEVAEKVLAAIRDERELLVVTRVGKIAWLVSRLAPRFYAHKMREAHRHEFGLR